MWSGQCHLEGNNEDAVLLLPGQMDLGVMEACTVQAALKDICEVI